MGSKIKKSAPKKPAVVGKGSGPSEKQGGKYSAAGTADRAAGAEANKRYGKNAESSGGKIGGKKPKGVR